MKQFHAVIAIAAAIGLTSSTFAQEEGKRPRPGDADGGNFRERLLKEFDADGDGKLSEDEQAKARAAASKLRAKADGNGLLGKAALMKRFDKDGDGQLSEAERAAIREFMAQRGAAANGAGRPPEASGDRIPAEVLKRFDKDGDGKLNEQERQAATKARAEFMKRNGDAGGRGRPGQEFLNREEFVKKFDKNGDGTLDESERKAASEAIAKLRGQRGLGAAPDGGGEARQPRVDKQELLKRFDADGDGQLDDQERAKAREEFQKRSKS